MTEDSSIQSSADNAMSAVTDSVNNKSSKSDNENTTTTNNNMKPLQIHDQCRVKWHGTNRNTSSSSSNSHSDNIGSTATTTKQMTGVVPSFIYLPAVIVERRIARMKKRTFTTTTSTAAAVVPTTSPITTTTTNKRQRNSPRATTTTISSSVRDTPSIDVSMKKELYDTLPADALEYYVHYTDHDRRLDEWVTLDRFQLNTLHRHNQSASESAKTIVADADNNNSNNSNNNFSTTVDADINRNRNNNNNDHEIDNDSTDDGGDGDGYSDSGTAVTATTTTGTLATAATRLSRRHSNISTTSSNNGMTGSNHGGGRSTPFAMTTTTTIAPSTTTTTTATANLLSSESDHGGGSVFSFRGGNWHAGSGSSSNADPALAAFEREHEETTKVKNIETIVMGSWLVAAWYYSPFPSEYSDVETLYVCEYCLSYMKKRKTFKKHSVECSCRQPPGQEIYRHDDISVYELDGKEHRAYCQKLCLLAKLFLDHKTLYYDVTPFYFYVVTKVDCHGAHIVGYFSKEKVSNEGYNLACILTFPQYQQAGYGKFIISLSYELTKREGKTGSPEKPLSDLGKVSYRSYWTHVLMHLFANCDPDSTNVTMNDMSQLTGIKTEDIISTLQSLDMIKVWKGQHVVYVQQSIIDDYMKLNKKFRLCQSEYLKWEPPNGRTNKDAV